MAGAGDDNSARGIDADVGGEGDAVGERVDGGLGADLGARRVESLERDRAGRGRASGRGHHVPRDNERPARPHRHLREARARYRRARVDPGLGAEGGASGVEPADVGAVNAAQSDDEVPRAGVHRDIGHGLVTRGDGVDAELGPLRLARDVVALTVIPPCDPSWPLLIQATTKFPAASRATAGVSWLPAVNVLTLNSLPWRTPQDPCATPAATHARAMAWP